MFWILICVHVEEDGGNCIRCELRIREAGWRVFEFENGRTSLAVSMYKIKINHELRGRVTPIDYCNCIV
jgi:hypothetical protein